MCPAPKDGQNENQEQYKPKTTKRTRKDLYAASNHLNSNVEKELRIQIPLDVYLQDPLVAKDDPKFGFDDEFHIKWEPNIADGPTSSRFAVVDYNGDTEELFVKAKWNEKLDKFVDVNGAVLDRYNCDNLQFHQVNVWAVLQRALDFFESSQGLGRKIPFGFEGNRLIVVPHAGYGRNAFYDRKSKSLQFYYFKDDNDHTVYTCLSTDIINHEFGHAMLDGIRPYYMESSQVQTGAFHEFIGDITAILIILSNTQFRHRLVELTDGRMKQSRILSSIAEEFGKAVSGRDYLRTATEELKMSDVQNSTSSHYVSQVLTSTMFDILIALADHYIKDRKHSAKAAFNYAQKYMQRLVIQPLDLLPPVDVTFRDYALAVLRASKLSNPTDPHNQFDLFMNVFKKREIITDEDVIELKQPQYLHSRIYLDIYHDIESIFSSSAGAYRFLDDNRLNLFIPTNQNFFIADLYSSVKFTADARRLPKQIILEYIWREEIVLEGSRFHEFEGRTTSIMCGGTLALDENGSVLSWFRKPGIETFSEIGKSETRRQEYEAGLKRRNEFLDNLAKRIEKGEVGSIIGGGKGFLGQLVPPLVVKKDDEILKFELSPHLHLHGDDEIDDHKINKRWEISS